MPEAAPASRREERRRHELERRRAHALAAASELFAAKGFHETQMAEIAANSELSLASLYAMFDGKEAIYEEVIHEATLRVSEAVVRRVERIDDPADRLLGLVDALFECFEESRDVLRIVMPGTAGLPWRLREKMGEGTREAVEAFRNWILDLCREAAEAGAIDGLDPEALGLTLMGTLTDAAAHTLERYPEEPVTRFAPAVRAIFERLVRGRAS